MISPEQLGQTILSFLTGGAAGALCTQYLTWRRQRTDVAFKLLEQFFARHTELGVVKGFLDEPAALADVQSLNRVLAIGDWFETVSLLCRNGVANGSLVQRAGIDKQI